MAVARGIPWIQNEQRITLYRRGVQALYLLSIAALATAVLVSLLGVPARVEELSRMTTDFGQRLSPAAAVMILTGGEIVLALVFFACAAVLIWRRPDSPMVLFLAMTLAAIGAAETGMSDALISPLQKASLPWLHAPVWALRAMEMAGALVLLYIFPDGRFVPSWTRWLAAAWIVYVSLCAFIPTVPFNPLDGPTWRRTPEASLAFGVAWFATGIFAQGYRLRRTQDPVQRQQLKWVGLGLVMAVFGMMLYYGWLAWGQSAFLPGGLNGLSYLVIRPLLMTVSLAMFPVCLSIAVLRYRLFDIDLLINRALVYGVLTLFVIAAYILIVTYIGAWFRAEGSLVFALAATGVVAVALQPLRVWVQRGVNRLMYGERDDPYAVLSRLGRRLEATLAPEAAAAALVTTVAQALKLPYASLDMRQGEWLVPVAAYGERSGRSLQTIPLLYQGETVGQLNLAPRAANAPFGGADRRLLDDLARQAGIAVYALRLTADLQQANAELRHARERLVTAREEERRRLHRDLHDGLGPTLASLTLRLDAARNLLASNPDRAQTLLAATSDQLEDTVSEVRRLVYDLRPPALDELGLVGSLQQFASRQEGACVMVELRQPLPPLPAAVEVAAYRIALEAITNAARHARAHLCTVRLGMEGDLLVLDVCDDGRGLAQGAQPGVGLYSMRERAEELGGVCTVVNNASGGVCVEARIPVEPEADGSAGMLVPHAEPGGQGTA